jgi:hypothetical protein
MTTMVSKHKTSFCIFKCFDTSIFIFSNSVDKNSHRQNISADSSTNIRTSPNVFYSFLFPPLFLPSDSRAVWLLPIANNLFATQANADPKQIKSLQSQTHFFGFFKPSFAITNLNQFVFARVRQKQNQLNFLTHKIGLLCSLFARVLDAPKCAPQACGIVFLLATKSCLTSFYNNTFGFT